MKGTTRHLPAEVTNMPLLAILAISAAGCFIVWAFTALRNARTEVRTTWNAVESALGERAVVVTRLVEAITPRLREDVAQQLTRAHQRMSSVVGPRSTEAADITLRSLLDPILTTMPSGIGLDDLKVELTRLNTLIDQTAAEYNQKVDAYESVRTNSAKKMFAEMLGFEKEGRFGRLTKSDASAIDALLV